ncbi:MAG TPA: SDR family NAD(P)-dependent oxidoreductase [Limnobacter sp.]|nr:SDR family NAD(P)-dependent oxidoreductase [Limnobacter sp.]
MLALKLFLAGKYIYAVIHQTAFRDSDTEPPLFYKRSRPRAFRRNRIAIAGCGQVGLTLLKQHTGSHFTATYRPGDSSHAKRTRIADTGAKPLGVDLQEKTHLLRMLSVCNRVIWMAPPDTTTPMDTTIRKAVLWLATRACLLKKGRPVLTYISTTGVYGDAQGEWIDERTPLNPQSERAKRRVQAETQVRLGLTRGVAVHVLRAPGIYGDERLPTDRLKAGTPAIVASEDSWSNHIHELDLARLALWVNRKAFTWAVVNACDEAPTKMGDYFDAVAQATGLPPPPRLSRKLVKAQVSPMMWSFMAESRKIRSRAMAKLGFKLRYPSVQAFLSKHFV